MHWSKNILTYLLFVLFAFCIWWVNAWHKQSVAASAETHQENESQDELPSQRITEKHLELPIEVIGVPVGKTIRIFPNKADVYVRVRVNQYEDISKEDMRIWCSYPMTQTDVLVLHADVASEEAMSVRIEPEEVEYIIEEE